LTKILLTGKTGQLGCELQQALAPLGVVTAPGRAQMDLTNPDAIRTAIRDCAPDIIVNAAGYTTVDKAEAEPELAQQINAVAPGIMAEEAQRLNALLVHYSTDYVYDGAKGTPYVEDDEPNPLNTYGKSKLAGEQAITASGCAHLILRASWIYSARGTNFVLTMLRLAREKNELAVVDDQVGSPTWAKTLALATADILSKVQTRNVASGIYHLSATGHTTRFAFAQMIVELAKQHTSPDTAWARIIPTSTANYPLPAARPLNAATSKSKLNRAFGIEMATWQVQIAAFVEHFADRIGSGK
jgi:dTDP-4-dehydrorhamnose reductase